METFTFKIFIYIIIVLSSSFHEYAHAWTAYRLGDFTAKDAGRLTINPLAHMDLFGTVLLPLVFLLSGFGFIGYAKPVPYNPYNLSDRKYGSLKIGFAGPAANLIIAIILGLVLRFFGNYILGTGIAPLALIFLGLIIYINIFLAFFNLLPFPPLDGSKVFFDLFPNQARYLESLGMFGIFVALMVGLFLLSPLANSVFSLITGQSFTF